MKSIDEGTITGVALGGVGEDDTHCKRRDILKKCEWVTMDESNGSCSRQKDSSDDTIKNKSHGNNSSLLKKLMSVDSTGEFASKFANIHRNSSQLLSISSFAPVCSNHPQEQERPGFDPILDTIHQLNPEDRTDRDLCCGLLSRFRSAFKKMWMLASVAVIYSGFMGPNECRGIPIAPVYVTAFGFILMFYLILGEISGVVAIWKGRRIGLFILALTQVFLIIWILIGYLALPIPYRHGANDTMVTTEDAKTMVIVGSMNFTGNCPVPHLCDCLYYNYMLSLFGFAHFVLVFVLSYTLVVCLCVTKAAHEVKKIDERRSRRSSVGKSDISLETTTVNGTSLSKKPIIHVNSELKSNDSSC
jgi:hypothetical protein